MKIVHRTPERDFPYFEAADMLPEAVATFLVALLDPKTVFGEATERRIEDFWVLPENLRGDLWLAYNRDVRPLWAGQRVYVPKTQARRKGYTALVDAVIIEPGRAWLRLRSAGSRPAAAASRSWPMEKAHLLQPCE